MSCYLIKVQSIYIHTHTRTRRKTTHSCKCTNKTKLNTWKSRSTHFQHVLALTKIIFGTKICDGEIFLKELRNFVELLWTVLSIRSFAPDHWSIFIVLQSPHTKKWNEISLLYFAKQVEIPLSKRTQII